MNHSRIGRSKTLALASCIAALFAAPAFAEDVVTVYSADGLKDGSPSWYQTEFDAFTKATGIKVQYVEGGSGVVVERVAKEKSNPQADLLVTLPPFIQKAAADGLLQASTPEGADQIPAGSKDAGGQYYALVNNYMNFIYNADKLGAAPKTFEDLLDPKFKGKIQYSTPGQAGDGTAVMVQVNHAFGSKEAGFAYMEKLQANNVGPSSSTGKLTALVNKGELLVANGDLQMNLAQMAQNPNIKVFWPAGPDGVRSTFALPYYAGLVNGAPHAEAGKKLLAFLLSKQAQEQVSVLAQGMPVRSDVQPTDENFKNAQGMMQGVTIWNPDWAKVLNELQADVAKWHTATGS
jgi:2-aminoethylphosphonate transport system substrate-binding protein